MAGYGKNPAWAGQQPGYGQQTMGGYQQQYGQSMGLGGLASGMGGISYPTPRSGQQQQPPQASPFMQQQQQAASLMGLAGTPGQAAGGGQRVFSGTVTKLHDSFGFVDDEVFFQMTVCKGARPRVNDRVMVEATYNATMPFKWNATSISVIPGQGGPPSAQGRGGAGFAGSGFGGGHGGGGGGGEMRGFGRGGGMRNRSPARRDQRDSFRRDDRSPARSSRKRSRSPSRKSRSPARRSRSRSPRSPPRRRARAQPRYNVSVPKISLHFPKSSVMELKKRYSSLYIPSDFFAARHLWTEAFPVQAPFKIQFPSAFQVMNREYVDPVVHNKFQFDPPDADYTWVAKVMLLACPNREDLIAKTCHLAGKDGDDRDNLVHPTRALKFLVGLKGKSETMAIGGPWSPSLDGADPANDPSVLIKTAIRTCGALTGIDLSGCTQWTNFIQIHYRRQETGSKPARTETVVIFFPDVWSVLPSKLEHDATCELYATACQAKLEGRSLPVPEGEDATTGGAGGDTSAMEEEAEEGGDEGGAVTKKTEPTHWKQLDPKTMKVNDLKQELEARGQTSKGLKSQLQARLQKLLKTEEEAEGNKDGGAGTAEEDGKDAEKEEEEAGESEVKVPDEKQKERILSAYKTPAQPCLFVHPNPKVKSGKFDCRVESLSVLLDYRTDDNKEGTFEVSLFAELFNEMLMRDSAFLLYRALASMPDKPKEKKKDKEDKKKDEEAKENGDKEDEDHHDKEDKKDKEDRKKRREEDEEEEKEMVTKDLDLLLGCSYFDLSHCGYFETKDVEEILMTLDLSLSRAEVRRLAARLVTTTRDQANYRTLTDVEAAKKDAEAPPAVHISVADLAKGFSQYIPGAGAAGGAGPAGGGPVGETDKLVKFRGTVLDLEKLMEKLDKSELVRTSADSKIVSLQKDLDKTKEHSDRYQQARDQLAGELKESRGRVRSLEDQLAASQGEAAGRLAALRDVLGRVKPLVEPPHQTRDQETETVKIQENGVGKEEEEEAMEADEKPEESKLKAEEKVEAEPEAAEAS